jgi:hypothetical protein
MESIARGNLILLGVIRYLDRPGRFFNAGGSDCFGDTGKTPADERPCSAHVPLWSHQGRGLFAGGELPRGLWPVRLHWNHE